MQIKLIGLNARYTHSCLALFYVRNELELNLDEVKVEIEQYTINDPYHELFLHINSSQPRYYFFSASIWNSDLIERLIRDILIIHPQCFCIVGGPQAEVVGNNVGMRNCVVVTGEIERVDKGLYQDLRQGKLKRRYSSKEKRTGYSFPYRPQDFKSHLLNRHIYYESSRGCPFSCTYCLSAAEKAIFHKPLDQVKEELRQILKFNPKVIRFVDRTFNDNLQRTFSIWHFLSEQQCDTVFHFEVSPDRFTDDMFTLLQRLPVGKFQFEMGIQSTNKETLEAVRRPIDTEKAEETIKKLRSFENIHLHVDLILGLPYETKKTYLQSFSDVFAMRPHYIQMGLLKILPDTPICHTASEFSYVYSKTTPYSVYANSWLEFNVMDDLYWFGECVEKFLNNRYFVSLWAYFQRKSEDIVQFFEELFNICKARQFFEKSATQELLISVLCEWSKNRKDRELIIEILRFDWLRCGHRFLIDTLQLPENKSSRALKKRLYHNLDKCHTSLSSEAEKTYYLKKGYVIQFSDEFLKEHGFYNGIGEQFFCFISDRENTLQRLCRFGRFTLTDVGLLTRDQKDQSKGSER